MIGRCTLRDNRTLFLFVFATEGERLPATLDAQKALLRELYSHGGWECRKLLGELERTEALYFDSVNQNQDAELVLRPRRAGGRCSFLRLVAGRTRLGTRDDLGLRGRGRTCKCARAISKGQLADTRHCCEAISVPSSAEPKALPVLSRQKHELGCRSAIW